MIKGGYKIIDFKGTALSDAPVTMTDILASLKNNYGKVVLLAGIIIGDNVMDDCFSTPLSDGDSGFKLNAYDGYISVTKAGAVTYTVASGSSILGLVTDIANLKKLNGFVFDTVTKLSALLTDTSVNNNSIITGYITGNILNQGFGINAFATIMLRKITTTKCTLMCFTENTGEICTANVTISGSSLVWSERYIFTGTEYKGE